MLTTESMTVEANGGNDYIFAADNIDVSMATMQPTPRLAMISSGLAAATTSSSAARAPTRCSVAAASTIITAVQERTISICYLILSPVNPTISLISRRA